MGRLLHSEQWSLPLFFFFFPFATMGASAGYSRVRSEIVTATATVAASFSLFFPPTYDMSFFFFLCPCASGTSPPMRSQERDDEAELIT